MKHSSDEHNQPQVSFQTTQWSEVLLAGDEGSPGSQAALCRMCEKYWYPVYAFLRRSGQQPVDAEDLTQAFFIDLIDKNKLAMADSGRGRFRAFLLTACKNFANNVHRHQSTLRRGGQHHIRSLDVDMSHASQRYARVSEDQWSPEQIFDRQWALELLELAIERVRKDYAARDQVATFEALQPFIAPVGESPSHAAIAEQLQISVGAVKTAVHRLRKRFGQILQQEVVETLADRNDAKDEMQILLNALQGR